MLETNSSLFPYEVFISWRRKLGFIADNKVVFVVEPGSVASQRH
jgi:hypothetical protein